MNSKLTSTHRRIRNFWDSKGFALLATLCVVIITATAVWTNQGSTSYVSPPHPTPDGHYASALMQESLSGASRPTPLPTTQPPLWSAPLPSAEVLQPFSAQMVRSTWSGVWSVHEAVDLKAEAGTPVRAIAAGVVADAGEDPLEGTFIELRHADGYISRYASLALTGALVRGDDVRAGQTIGFVGSTAPSEEHLGPHLHLQVSQNGSMLDPLPLFD